MIKILICETKNCENYDNHIPYDDPADLCICAGCGNQMRVEDPKD